MFRIIFIAILSSALAGNVAIAEEGLYSNGRIITTSGQTIDFTSLNMKGDKAEYTGAEGTSQMIQKDKILELEVKSGNEALLWAVGMGAGAFVGATMGINNARRSGYGTENGNSIILTLTAVSAAIGAMIGGNKSKYKKVYSNPKYSFSPNINIFPVGKKNDGLMLTLTFSI